MQDLVIAELKKLIAAQQKEIAELKAAQRPLDPKRPMQDYRILVVDDNLMALKLLNQHVRMMGLTRIETATGARVLPRNSFYEFRDKQAASKKKRADSRRPPVARSAEKTV